MDLYDNAFGFANYSLTLCRAVKYPRIRHWPGTSVTKKKVYNIDTGRSLRGKARVPEVELVNPGTGGGSVAGCSRGQKRSLTPSEVEPSSKRFSESSADEKPVLQASSFIEALGKVPVYFWFTYTSNSEADFAIT